VRDRKEFWLSSGNWQSSNQPPHDPLKKDISPPLLRTYNREWSVVIDNAELAGTFEDHLVQDAADAANVPEAVAAPDLPDLWVSIDYFYPTEPETEAPPRYFAPLVGNRKVQVQPLLTPDNYAREVLKVLEAAQEKIYFQNQSLTIKEEGSNAADFEALVAALRDKQNGGLDVRIIFRRIGDLREKITLLKDYGFDMSKVRVQTNCHTKGIVVDSKVVVLGSHNWSNAGTVFNRDASLIFWDDQIAKYYEDLFLYDWRRSGTPKINESVPPPRIVRPEDELPPPPGMVRVPWREWFGE
jgi:phosphatidylserine/phosphatidylglycerophosphate/cardiolipin synthase-like enzyme